MSVAGVAVKGLFAFRLEAKDGARPGSYAMLRVVVTERLQ